MLVHGGGRHIDAALAARGIPRRAHEGLRVTDGPTLAVVVDVLRAVNRGLVDDLTDLGAAWGPGGLRRGSRARGQHPPVGGVDLGAWAS